MLEGPRIRLARMRGPSEIAPTVAISARRQSLLAGVLRPDAHSVSVANTLSTTLLRLWSKTRRQRAVDVGCDALRTKSKVSPDEALTPGCCFGVGKLIASEGSELDLCKSYTRKCVRIAT